MTEAERFMRRLGDVASSPLERALLQAGMGVRVSDASRAAALEALGLGPKTSRLARVRAMPFGRAAWLIAAMVVSAAAVAIPLVQRVNAERSVAREGEKASIALQAKPPGASVATGIESVLPNSEPLTVPVGAQSVKSSRPSEASASQRVFTGAPARNLLAAELAALDAARARLSAGDPRAALMLLDAYQREFPKPRLALEAEVLRIDALDRAGQTEAARRRAAAFVQSHPKGVLTGRVRRYLEK